MILDKTDRQILALLQKNAQLTYKEISEHTNLSLSPVHERIKKLEKAGVISKTVALVNPEKVGMSLLVYCQITLLNQNKEFAINFNKIIKKMPEILECSFVSGNFDYILKIVVKDMNHFHEFHRERLASIEGVSLINSIFVMSQIKNTTAIPLT